MKNNEILVWQLARMHRIYKRKNPDMNVLRDLIWFEDWRKVYD